MSAFKNMKLSMKLGVSFGTVLLLLIIVGATGYWGVNSIAGITVKMLQTDANVAEHSAQARANILGLRRFEKDAFINIGSANKVEEYIKKWNEQREHLTAKIADLEKIITLQQDKDIVKDMKNNFSAYVNGFNKVSRMVQDGKIKTTSEANAAIGEYKDVIHKMEQRAICHAEHGK